MLCSQCGKEAGNASVCPYCGAEGIEFDPFVSLGDLCDTEEVIYAGEACPMADIEESTLQEDPFFSLGDLSGEDTGNASHGGPYRDEMQVMDMDDPFHSLGDLDDPPIVPDDITDDSLDEGGFRSLRDLDYTDDELNDGQEHFHIEEDPRPIPPARKSWRMIASCLIVSIIFGIVGMFWFSKDNTSSKYNICEEALYAKISDEIIPGDNLPLTYQYSNAILNAIKFEVLEINEPTNTITVRFTYVDAISLADSYTGSLEQDVYYNYCIDRIISGTAPTCTEAIEVHYIVSMSNGSENISIQDNIDLADVMTGGIASIYMEQVRGG